MDFLKPVIWTLTKDPYWVGPQALHERFAWSRSYIGTTDQGLKVRYRITCDVQKVSHERFRKAGMLDVSNQNRLIDEWHESIFRQKFAELGFSFKYVITQGGPGAYVCGECVENGRSGLGFDPNGFLATSLLEKFTYEKCGCRIKLLSFDIENDMALVRENYDMLRLIKIRDIDKVNTTPQFRLWEEGAITAMLKRHAELQAEFQHLQSNQQHTSRIISVNIRMVGSTIELAWQVNSPETGVRIRGYRNDQGFTVHSQPDSTSGHCILDTENRSGRLIQQLQEGKEYFYAFGATKNQPIYAGDTVTHAVRQMIGAPLRVGSETIQLDALRFSLHVPPQAELSRIQRLIDKMTAKPVNESRQFIDSAIQELCSFVEFEESLAAIQKQLIARIKTKGHPRNEERELIQRLQAVVERIRAR
jgi:hypothetical protein